MSASSTRAIALSIVVALLVGACSSGPSAEALAFCDDYASLDGLINTGPDEDPEAWVTDVVEGLETAKADAPEVINANVTRVADALLVPIEALDEEGFFEVTGSEQYAEDSAVIKTYLTDDCGFSSAEVSAVDYAYQADLDGLEPGVTAVTFKNDGTEVHEMVLVRLNDDTTESISELLELPEEEAMAKVTDAGFAIGPPGAETTFYADLEAGRYAFFCFLPVGSTSFEVIESAEGPPHFTQGMIKEFTIEG